MFINAMYRERHCYFKDSLSINHMLDILLDVNSYLIFPKPYKTGVTSYS